jgi:hypothetical protein
MRPASSLSTSRFSVISTGMASNRVFEANPLIPDGLRGDDRALGRLGQPVRRAPCKLQGIELRGVDDRSSYRWRHPKSRPGGDDPRRAGQAPRSPPPSSSSPHAWDWMSGRCWSSASRHTNGHGDAGAVSHLGLLARACGVVADRLGRMGHPGSGHDRQLAIHILRHSEIHRLTAIEPGPRPGR